MIFVQVVKNVDYFFYLILNSIFTGMTIGVPINEFNEMKDLEVMTFRRNILDVCKSSIEKRQRRGKASQALYVYPPDLESSPTLPSHLQDKIREVGHRSHEHLVVGLSFITTYAICAYHH
jgi:phosphatidylinositol-4,5-bisphosphate 3-kinase